MTYSAYLRSPEWAAKRDEALLHHAHECRTCGTGDRLQVHHKTYVRLGRERMSDLIVLCADCHTEIHRLRAPHDTIPNGVDADELAEARTGMQRYRAAAAAKLQKREQL